MSAPKNVYCLPLQYSSAQEIEAAIEEHEHEFAYFEVWLELMDGPEAAWVRDICQRWPERLIFLFRRPKLEAPLLPPSLQRELLEAVAASLAWVDFDWGQLALITQWRQRAGMDRVLLSFHDYHQTPSDEALEELLEKMAGQAPWICKIATMCQKRADALRLMRLCVWFPERFPSQRFLFLGMGPHGLMTRVFGARWGNEMTFAPVALSEASAPGQLTRKQYEMIELILA